MNKLSIRFAALINEADEIENAKTQTSSGSGSGWKIDPDLFLSWKVKAKNLLIKACGENSQHFIEFTKSEIIKGLGYSHYATLKQLRAIMLAAQDDFDGGYLISMRLLVQAEVFDNELDQARELLNSGYKAPAAVVAGVVLETAIRDLCTRFSVPYNSKDKLDKLNADLVKATAYNTIQQKRVTYLAGIRNSAAHGDHDAYSHQDVTTMISEVEQFLAVNLH